MTERQKQLIEAYIPSPRDESLGIFECFVEDSNGKIQRVEITDIMPSNDYDTIYLVVQVNTRKRVKGWLKYDGFSMGYLYDNKQDCKDCTHTSYSLWEDLRKLQENEVTK